MPRPIRLSSEARRAHRVDSDDRRTEPKKGPTADEIAARPYSPPDMSALPDPEDPELRPQEDS